MSTNGIEVRDNPESNRFEVEVGSHMAIAEYTITSDAIMFRHTEVPAALEGRGIGSALVKAGLQAARDRGLKVIPVCPFVSAYMKKHPETQDLLHPDYPI